MQTINLYDAVAGAIIAGGYSRRFGHEAKALAVIEDTSLIERIYHRLATQLSCVWVNAAPDICLPPELADKQIDDATPARTGPLLGVLSCLQQAAQSNYQWLVVCPCDTPFIPDNLCERLLEQCQHTGSDLAIAKSGDRYHPSVSLWSTRLLPTLKTAVLEHAKSGFKQYYLDTNHCFVDWPTEPIDPFFNINFGEDLEAAIDIINSGSSRPDELFL